MRFITEEDIRDIYKAAPFMVYEPSHEVKLTPGARQWLMDRGLIDLEDDPREANVTHGVTKPRMSVGASRESIRREGGCGSDRFGLLIETLKTDYYRTGLALASTEVSVSARVMSLAEQLTRLRDGADIRSGLGFCECTGIKDENFGDLLEDCFDITEYHAAQPRGEEIIALHLLRCKTRLLEQAARESGVTGERFARRDDTLLSGLHEIINTLSRMICAAFGSKVCQKGR
jgi:ethanolamine utilization cobalamin adenosyltransferase